MTTKQNLIHQKGESQYLTTTEERCLESRVPIETFGGRVHVEWDPHSAATPLGQLPFFIEFLKLGNRFEPWVAECPLYLTSNNAPSKTDVLGTLLLSILAGHRRYSHITSIRCDAINPSLLGMGKVVSSDSMRRNLANIPADKGDVWIQNHLHASYCQLLKYPWIMDIDTTIKPLYGRQEGAVVGYNPSKPGRPSHTYHSFFLANLRLLLDVEVHPGNEMASSYTAPSLWSLLELIPKGEWPTFIRGDSAFGTNGVMSVAEAKGLPYLFKIKQTSNVKRLIGKLISSQDWVPAGKGWEGQESELKLTGWNKSRRVIVLRRRIQKSVKTLEASRTQQLKLNLPEIVGENPVFEHAVLVTTLQDEILTIAQHYRDRADSENIFDELKNQWGWGGFTTNDLKRCKLLARVVGLVYNWWNIYCRLADPDKHIEAITSRPLLLHAVGKQSSHSGQTLIRISSTHGKMDKVKRLISRIKGFFDELKLYAQQLSPTKMWEAILAKALGKYLQNWEQNKTILIPNTG